MITSSRPLVSYSLFFFYQVFPSENEDSLYEKSVISKAVSSRLTSRGNTQAAQGANLRSKLEMEMKAVDKLEDTVRRTGIADNNVAKQLQKLEDLRGMGRRPCR